jgi:hypothetical protein
MQGVIAPMAAWVGRASGGALRGAGRRMASSAGAQAAGAWRARAGRAALLSGAAVVGSSALLASRGVARAESSDMEEEPSMAERAMGMLGLGSWAKWAREPAERGGCPPGKLLPDPMDLPPGVVQRTLVLSLEDTLIHTEWDRKFGHRTRKRPGLDAFLAHMSQYYEIVIFTSALSSYAQPITQQMQDTTVRCPPSRACLRARKSSAPRLPGAVRCILPGPWPCTPRLTRCTRVASAQAGYFQHALFNEHTKDDRIKDLSYLNRDLRHVIIVDTNPRSYRLQKYNGIAIKPWDGDLNDTELLNLVPFLEAVFKEDVSDVREVP